MSKLEELIQKYCPDGVEYKTLKDVCTDFIVPMRDRPKVFDGDIPWCRIEDKQGQYFNGSLSGLGVSEKVIKQMNLKVFPTGTVICSCSASLGSYAINTRPLITNQTFIGIVCGELLFNKYLLYFMETQTAKLISLSNSGTIPYISRKKFEELEIPTPPLPVQKEIVRVLDTFTELHTELGTCLQSELQKRQQQYSFYRDLLLTNLKDYKEYCISDIACYRRGSFPQPYTNNEFYGGKESMPFVQVADIANEGFLLNERTNQTISKNAQPKSVFVPKGTVICSLQGSIGRVAITQYDAYVDRTIAIFTSIDPRLDKRYFALQLSRVFSIAKEKARGGTIKTITKEEFSGFSIQVPPLSEQQKIVGILGRFNTLTTCLSNSLQAEISARKQQYEYYRDTLLSFRSSCS